MNNEVIIDNLLAQFPDSRLVLYSTLHDHYIVETICALLNGYGGDIIVGIDNQQNVVGIANNAAIKELKETVKNEIAPMAPVSFTPIDYRNKQVLLIGIWPGVNKPYSFKNQIFVRIGSITKLANSTSLRNLVQDLKKSEFHWERQTVLGAEISDLDFHEVKKAITRYQELYGKMDDMSSEDFLVKFGLMRGGSLTNAAIILFAIEPMRYLPQCKMRITAYGVEKGGNILLFDKLYHDHLFRNISFAWDFFDSYLRKGSQISGLVREEGNYPRLAFREGLMNALVHRDYSSVSGSLHIEIFPDRLQITNPGGLPTGITVEDLSKDHVSILRNPDIAQVCYIKGYIEMLGTGTLRMIEDCKSLDYPAPVWEITDHKTQLIFKGVTHRIASEGVNEGVSEGVKGIIEGATEGVSEGVKDILVRLYRYIADNEGKKVPDLATRLSLGESTVERHIKTLRDAGLIHFKGAAKTGGYFVTKKV